MVGGARGAGANMSITRGWRAVMIFVIAVIGMITLAAAGEGDKPPWVPDEHVVGTFAASDFAGRLPEWENAAREHHAEDDVIEALRNAPPARIVVLFATWCGDSYEHVPVLLSALREAGNPELEVEWVGLDRAKSEPGGRGVLWGVERVPTVVVLRDEVEVGRIIETPQTTMDRDVSRLLQP